MAFRPPLVEVYESKVYRREMEIKAPGAKKAGCGQKESAIAHCLLDVYPA